MAKASRVAARTQKALYSVDERLERIELMLEAMMTKKQRADFDALLATMDDGAAVEETATVTIALPSWAQQKEEAEAEDVQPETA